MKKDQLIPLALGFAVMVLVSIFFYIKRPSVFGVACTQLVSERNDEKSADSNLCSLVEKSFFTSRDPVQKLTPELVGAPALAIDHRIRWIAFHDPRYLSGFAYCYFVYRGWLNPKEMSPIQLSHSASGFAILKSELHGYADWLNQSPGVECKGTLGSQIQLAPANLEIEMGSNESIIAFNPIGAIHLEGSLKAVVDEALLTVNHERIHVIQVSCAGVDREALLYWKSMSAAEKEKLRNAYPSYDWNNPTVAVREAFAYRYEKDVGTVMAYAKECSWEQ